MFNTKKFFIFHGVGLLVCLIAFIFFNVSISAIETSETTEITETIVTSETIETTVTTTKISNFDIKDLSSYIDSKDYVVSYCYKGNNKGNYIVYPYKDLYTTGNSNYNAFYTNYNYYFYDTKNKTFTSESLVFGSLDWRYFDTYVIGSTYDIKNKESGETVFFKTYSNSSIAYNDVTSGTIYNGFFKFFKPLIPIVLPVIILIFAFYKCWGWIRGTLQGL